MAACSGAATSLPDPMKSLTEADRQTIKATWAVLFGNAEENGRLIFVRFFTDYPDSKAYFKTIPTEGDLLRNRELAFHGRRVMVALDHMIASLSNQPRLCTLIGRLAESHRDKHGVPVKMFQLLFQAMLNVFQDLLGEDFTRDSMASWQKFFEALHEEFQATYITRPRF
ncbi:cytoglobin-like [Tiliqua scincoides]|uniref:cytoglobin-like n=1 Tax=Tiliqua scincoides TaxID=71010 RepID=UPI003462E6A3